MSSRRRTSARLVAVTALAAAALVPALPAVASCAGPQTPASLLEQDGDVVLGTAEEVDGHRALLSVEAVWSGEDRAPRVWVVTGETMPDVGSSSDVELDEGQRYLVGLQGDRTGACRVLAVGATGTETVGVATATAAEVDAARPADVRAPVDGADDGGAPGPPVAAVAAGVAGWAALTAVVLLAARSVRRRQRRRSRRRAEGGPGRNGGGPGLR